MKNWYIFYSSYHNLYQKLDRKIKEKMALAINEFVFENIEPDFEKDSEEYNIWNKIKRIILQTKEEDISIISKNYINNLKQIDEDLKNKILDWFLYKKENKEKCSRYSIKILIDKIIFNADKYGKEKIISLIDLSITNNYKSILWEKLEEVEPIPSVFRKKYVKDENISEEELKEIENLKEYLKSFKE